MKRRKIVGLVLLIGTICYLLASLLALYQNQRVKMEKGIEEALKAYSDRESLNVKELSKDFNLILNEKLDISDMNRYVMKCDGSFATMEKSINSVSNEISVVEYNYNRMNERLDNMEKLYNAFYDEIVNMATTYEASIADNKNSIIEIKKEMEKTQDNILKVETDISDIQTDILKMQTNISDIQTKILDMQTDVSVIKSNMMEISEYLTQNERKQQEDVNMLQEQITLCEQRIADLEGNTLYFQYDSESKTLNLFGKEGGSDEE